MGREKKEGFESLWMERGLPRIQLHLNHGFLSFFRASQVSPGCPPCLPEVAVWAMLMQVEGWIGPGSGNGGTRAFWKLSRPLDSRLHQLGMVLCS